MNDDSTLHYIYLIQEREFVKMKENIYKIGKTKQPNLKRLCQYPKGSVLLLQSICKDCDNSEKKIIDIYKNKYKQRIDIGTEYFEGDYEEMMHDINCIISGNIQQCDILQPATPAISNKQRLLNVIKEIEDQSQILSDLLETFEP